MGRRSGQKRATSRKRLLYILYQVFHSNCYLQRHTKHQKYFNRSLYTLGKGTSERMYMHDHLLRQVRDDKAQSYALNENICQRQTGDTGGLFWGANRKTRLQLISYMPSLNLRSLICKMGIIHYLWRGTVERIKWDNVYNNVYDEFNRLTGI